MQRILYNPFARILAIGVVFLFALPAIAAPNRAPEIQIIDYSTREVQESWMAFDESYSGGVEAVVGDVGGDGIDEVIVAQSGGHDAHGLIRIFRTDGSLIREVPVFADEVYQSELDLAVGDVDADGKDEVIASFPYNSRSMVYIFDDLLRFDLDTVGAFEAFPRKAGGAGVTVGNVGGGEEMEIIVTSGAGTSPRVRVFDKNGVTLTPDIIPFSQETTYGLTAATVNTGGGEYDDLVIGLLNRGETWIKNYRIDSEYTFPVLAEKRIWTRQYRSGVQIDGIDVDYDGTQEIVVAPAGDQLAEITVVRGDGEAVPDVESLYVYEEEFRGGVHVAVANVDKDKSPELIISPRQQRLHGDITYGEKYIEIDLSEQIEYIWENGYLRNVYLISSGLASTPSPIGEHQVLKKIAVHTYDDRPEYFFPGTKWNLRYKAGGTGSNYYIHTAYWHNNFGHPMSHGCINMREKDVEFVYHWADIGTPVWIHQ